MHNRVLIRRVGNWLDTRPVHRPFTPEELSVLTYDLTYVRKDFSELYTGGPDARVRTERYALYTYVSERIATSVGLFAELRDSLQSLGFECCFLDETPEPQRDGAYVPDWVGLYRVYRPHGTTADGELTFRPKQEECLQQITKSCGGLIDATVAFGKSTLIEAICLLYPRANIHIVVRGVSIINTIYRRLIHRFPNIGIIGDGSYSVGERITIVSADSLHLTDADADFVIGDEAHILGADKYAGYLIGQYPFARRFGLSATLGDSPTNADKMVSAIFGPTIFQLTYPQAVSLGLVTPIRVLLLRIQQGPRRLPRRLSSRDGTGIWRNTKRNRAIAAAVRAIPKDKQVLVLTDRVEHALYLNALLPDASLAYGVGSQAKLTSKRLQELRDAGVVREDFTPMSRGRLRRLQQAFERREERLVIATDVWNTGVDFTGLDVVVRADTRSSKTTAMQGAGRSSRLHTGKAEATLIDCWDEWSPDVYLPKSEQRVGWYKKFGWPVSFWEVSND